MKPNCRRDFDVFDRVHGEPLRLRGLGEEKREPPIARDQADAAHLVTA